MKNKSHIYMAAFAILFYFFIQLTGTLVEAIYISDLLNTAIDEKVLGLLFFFTPLLLFSFRKKVPGIVIWLTLGILIFSRGLTPHLDTSGRLLTSGVGTGAALIIIPFLIFAKPKGKTLTKLDVWVAAGLGLGLSISIMLRTVNFTIDYSLTEAGSWAGWGLGIVLLLLFTQLEWGSEYSEETSEKGVTSATFGIMMVLTLSYFVFSAPGILARWTEGNYTFIVTVTSLLALGWVALTIRNPAWSARISSKVLFFWNLLFSISLVGTILAHQVHFPMTPDSPPVVIGQSTWIQQIPLVLTLLLYPVIFLDLQVFTRTIRASTSSPKTLVPGMLLGSLTLVLLVFMNIFTNVWGYVEPVSPFFRNKLWLPFVLITVFLIILSISHKRITAPAQKSVQNRFPLGWMLLLAGILLITSAAAGRTDRTVPTIENGSSLVLMTYNIQQANDEFGSKSYQQQLAIIQSVSPDILALQESDSARISLNNNDYVRYYASKLGYYSYYGPTPLSGTYGTAILSKYPLQNPRSVFSYSDQDEIGTAEAEIVVGGNRFTIYNVHPDGSDTAMLIFAETLLSRSMGKDNVIALGDYNLRENETAYEMINAVYTNAWLRVYPNGISDTGVDMSGSKRIDHIFISRHLKVLDPIYLLAPESATDHPAHWATLYWED